MHLSQNLLYEAVREGVKEAILTMTESGDGYTGPIIRNIFLKAIEDGVFNAIHEMSIDSNEKMSKLKDKAKNICVDPDRILEMDVLRWLLLMGENTPHFIKIAQINLSPKHFRIPVFREIYQIYLDAFTKQQPLDLLSLAINMDDTEAQIAMSEIIEKKINREKAEDHFMETIQKMLDRHWMQAREDIRIKIQSGKYSDEEVFQLAKEFNELKKNPPSISFA